MAKKKQKTIKQRIVERLNKGFGYNLSVDDLWITRESRRWTGAWSWYFINPIVGSLYAATKCLKWKQWAITGEGEIFEYLPERAEDFADCKIEKID